MKNVICQNPYCEAEATHQAPHNEHYCAECIHEHVYDECDPDPVRYDGKTEIVRQVAEQQGWDTYHHPAFATSQAQEDLDYESDIEGYDFINKI